MSQGRTAAREEDTVSEIGGDAFATPETLRAFQSTAGGGVAGSGSGNGPSGGPTMGRPLERAAPDVGRGWGRGPVPVDRRKFRYDVLRARATPALEFSASKADRMDALDAGDMLHGLHHMFGIDVAEEARISAFDKALFLEHTINGASLMQPGRGSLKAADMVFDVQPIKTKLGVHQRRFFRAFADEIAEVNKEVLAAYDPYDPVAAERATQVIQVAVERGLQKFPHLAHDSSEACTLSNDERMAVLASKRLVIPNSLNNADKLPDRVPQTGGIAEAQQGGAGGV